MKANEDKLLEKLTDTVMKNSILKTPSFDFTSKVMSQVLSAKTNEIYVYKPLISKSVFVFIFVCFVVLFTYLFKANETQTYSWVSYFNFNNLYNNFSISLLNFSKVTIYSIVFSTLLLFIQISFLKKHFDNQFKE